MKFTKKPLPVDAIQFAPELTHQQLHEWAGLHDRPVSEASPFRFSAGGLYIQTLDGEMRANGGDWIVRLPSGAFTVHSKEFFEQHFDPAPAAIAPAPPVDTDSCRAKYDELIYAVGRNFPGETRHQTALRYIREAERADESHAAALANKG